LKEKPEEEVMLEFMDEQGNVIKTFKDTKEGLIPAKAGLSRFNWDMRYPDARGIKGGTYLYGGNLRGPEAVPGTYQVKLTVGGESMTTSLTVKKDPRIPATQEDLQEQFDLLIKIRDKLSLTHDMVNQILSMKNDIAALQKKAESLPNKKLISEESKKLEAKLNGVLNALVELEVRGYREFNFYLFHHMFDHHRLKLNSRLGSIQGVVASTDRKPTDQCYESFDEVTAELNAQFTRFKEIIEKDVPEFNNLVEEQGIPAVSAKKKNNPR
jgi:ribosome-associated translation inhibitor RaiA